MLDWWNRISLGLFDLLLGWLLGLPTDAALIVVAVGTAAILTFVRLFTTDQDLLARAAADRRRLKELIRDAKKRGDRDAVKRHRAVKAMIAMRTFPSEGKPLLASIVPIAMLATWAFARLAYDPPRAGEEVEVRLTTPISAAGEAAHVVPVEGLRADGWVKPVEAVTDCNPPHGLAAWRLRGAAADKPYRLIFRFRDESYSRDLLVGQRMYSDPIADHGGLVTTEVRLRPRKLFNIVPGIPAIAFDPWLVGYLVLVIPSAVIVKRVFRIH